MSPVLGQDPDLLWQESNKWTN